MDDSDLSDRFRKYYEKVFSDDHEGDEFAPGQPEDYSRRNDKISKSFFKRRKSDKIQVEIIDSKNR